LAQPFPVSGVASKLVYEHSAMQTSPQVPL
jgi:hypothetical protein